LFFPAISSDALLKHLEAVCTAENIRADEAALKAIIQETEGSARDALNLLEQVRFSHPTVSKDAVLAVLGHVPEPLLIDLFTLIAAGDVAPVISFFEERKLASYTPLAVWQKLQELIRSILFVKYGVAYQVIFEDKERVGALARRTSLECLTGWLRILYDNEMILLKTTAQQGVLEMILLQMCQTGSTGSIASTATAPMSTEKKTVIQPTLPSAQSAIAPVDNRWADFLEKVNQLSDPLLNSIFKQAHFRGYEEKTYVLTIAFAKDTTFFGEWLKDTEDVWKKFLQEIFHTQVKVIPVFEQALVVKKQEVKVTQPIEKKATVARRVGSPNKRVSPMAQARSQIVNVSDKEKWKTANILLDAFGGVVVESEGQHEKEK
jgi:DNA polymerase-3 subunit gamma/tau